MSHNYPSSDPTPIVLVHQARERWISENQHLTSPEIVGRYLAPFSEVSRIAGELVDLGHDCYSFSYKSFDPSKFRLMANNFTGTGCFWNMTDGSDIYIGSLVPSYARLVGHAFIGSPTYTQALCQYKHHWKAILNQYGVNTPKFVAVHKSSYGPKNFQNHDVLEHAAYPCFTKPCSIGDSGGLDITVPICYKRTEVEENLERFFQYGVSPILCEAYIDGPEYAYVFAGDQEQYDLVVRQEYSSRYLSPSLKDAPQSFGYSATPCPERADIYALGRYIVRRLGLKDYATVEFRESVDGNVYAIDINAVPFLSGNLFAALSHFHGITFKTLINSIVNSGLRQASTLTPEFRL